MTELENKIQELRRSRGWDLSDTNPILVKSIVVEAAELLECYQWNEVDVDMEAVKSEIADILMYAISFCIDNNWDYKEVILSKFDDVKERYPEIEND